MVFCQVDTSRLRELHWSTTERTRELLLELGRLLYEIKGEEIDDNNPLFIFLGGKQRIGEDDDLEKKRMR